jgi:hypothetical protein
MRLQQFMRSNVFMSSLVLELQRDAFEASVSVLNLLRKALVVAKKLGLEEFQEWVDLELKGYSENAKIPEYRLVTGEVKAWNPYHGWVSVILNVPEIAETISKRYVSQPISEIEKLVDSESGILIMRFPKKIELQLMKSFELPLQPVLHISKVNLFGILEATRDVVLRWSLKLEEDGIIGEGMTFSSEEKQIAQAAHYTIGTYIMSQTNSSISDNHSINIQAGSDVSGVIGGSDINSVLAGGDISGNVTNTLSQHTSSDINEIIKLTELLYQQLKSIPSENQDVAADSLETLKAEIITPTKPGRLKSSLFALWSVGKDVATFANAVSAIAERLGIHMIS